MKIGFIDYYLDEWHANNYPAWIEKASNGEYTVAYAYGEIDSPLGGRTTEQWCKESGINVHLTIDNPQPDWDGHVGFVPNYVKELNFDTAKTVLMCGPPIMIKFTLAGLMELGFSREQIYTTMELRMKCALGKCGRCNIGDKYVCKDGPVFRFDQLDELPDEY